MTRLSVGIPSARCHSDGVAVLAGPHLDERLSRANAVAMALDASTILLSSQLAALSATMQRLIICHELAHIVQLRRGGSDPEDALEAEAWHAAGCAVRGQPFRIRLGANRPLFATALVAVDDWRGAAAMNHYIWFDEQLVPFGPISVRDFKRVRPAALDALLDAIIATFPGTADKSFVLCAHGNKEGLTMPVVPNSPRVVANTKTLRFLMQPNVTTQKLTAPPGVQLPSAQQIAAIVGKMQQVRQLGSSYVEFRGCAIGAEWANLEAMREFLGCASVSAPNVNSSWAMAQPNIIGVKQFDGWSKTPGVMVSQYPPGRCGIVVNWAAHRVVMAADSEDAVAFWLKDHFVRVPPFPPAPQFESWMVRFGLHGLHTTPILFPMDAGYAAHIKRVMLTPGGLVRM